MTLILGIHTGNHDSAACLFEDYELLAAVAQERLTRSKGDGGRVPVEAMDECLTIAGRSRADVEVVALGRSFFPERYCRSSVFARFTTLPVRRALGRERNRYLLTECRRHGTTDTLSVFDAGRFLMDHELGADTKITFTNHHLAHALPCLFHTDWDEALLFTADGTGDNAQYSVRLFGEGRLETLDGGDEAVLLPKRVDSLGEAYSYATEALGFVRFRDEGKLTGLAARGEPVFFEALAAHFRVDDEGYIGSDFAGYAQMKRRVAELVRSTTRENASASIQRVLETVLLESIGRLLQRHPRRFLGLSGGVFANVRLNQRLAEELPLDELMVFPAMGDQGQPYGAALAYLLERDGLPRWLEQRRRLESLYCGRDFGDAIDHRLAADPAFERVSTESVRTSAELLHAGRVVALYTRGMEYGPRALGARSILAAAVDPGIGDVLNARLSRNDFMPFAPVVLADDAEAVFELGPRTRYAARFMTVACAVREPWRARIPAVVHVDGTARPQIIERRHNALYYDITAAYKALSGVPVLVNTSFNAHEEPIINTPDECARALARDRVDFVVTDRAVYGRK